MKEEKKVRSMSWLRLDIDMVDHPRVAALEDLLGGDRLAGWYVVRLWCYAMRYFPSGAISARAGRVERACDWRGDEGVLVEAMARAGWVTRGDGDVLLVHDWNEHQGAAVAKAAKDVERKAAARAENAPRAGPPSAGRGNATGNVTRRNETRRDDEEEDQPPLTFDIVSPLAGLEEAPDAEIEAAIEALDARGFWRWSESQRRAVGWAPEKWPNAIALRAWWVEARHGARPVKHLLDAWRAFARDAHWRAATPPAPFAAWMKGWNKYLQVTR